MGSSGARELNCGPAQDQRDRGRGVDQQFRTSLETGGSTNGPDVVDEPDAHSIACHDVAEVVAVLLESNHMQRS